MVGEKEAFCAVNVSCFPSKDLTCLDLFGLTAFASVAWSLEGFWLVPLRLRFAGWRVLDFHMVAELVCLELSEK